MAMVSMRQLLDEAAAGGYGVGGVQRQQHGADPGDHGGRSRDDSPVIVQASRGARSYTQDRFLYHLMLAAAELYPEIPVALHQDHGNSPATCMSAIEQGFTSVMMDGSLKEDGKTPADFDYNVQVTREVVEHAARGRRHGRGRARRDRSAVRRGRRRSEARSTSPTPTRRSSSSSRPASTRSQSPSARATAPTSSRASPTARCSR